MKTSNINTEKKTKLRNKGNDNQRISQSKTGYEGKTKTEVTVTEMFLKLSKCPFSRVSKKNNNQCGILRIKDGYKSCHLQE